MADLLSYIRHVVSKNLRQVWIVHGSSNIWWIANVHYHPSIDTKLIHRNHSENLAPSWFSHFEYSGAAPAFLWPATPHDALGRHGAHDAKGGQANRDIEQPRAEKQHAPQVQASSD